LGAVAARAGGITFVTFMQHDLEKGDFWRISGIC
jgi:hypothetical protein